MEDLFKVAEQNMSLESLERICSANVTSYSVHNICSEYFDGLNSSRANTTIDMNLLEELANLFVNSIDSIAHDKAREILTKPLRIFSIVIFIFGLLANIITIQAIIFVPKQHRTAHLKFIISLACSDIFILCAILSGDLLYIFSTLHSDCTKLLKTLLLDVPLVATLLNLLAMATDHYLASFKQLHYPHLMTRSRSNTVICLIWFFSVLIVFTEVLIGLNTGSDSFEVFCMATMYDSYSIEQMITVGIFLALIVIILIYIRIYTHVKKSLPKRRCKKRHMVSPTLKTLVTTMLFIGTFVLCWTPEGIFHIYIYVKSITDKNFLQERRETLTFVNDVLFLVLQLNSLADPIIYAVRLPKVKQGCRALFCKKSNRAENLEKSFIQLKQTNYTSLSVSLPALHSTSPMLNTRFSHASDY